MGPKVTNSEESNLEIVGFSLMGSRTLPQVKQRTGMIIFFRCPNCSGLVSMEEGFHEVYYLYKGNHSGRV